MWRDTNLRTSSNNLCKLRTWHLVGTLSLNSSAPQKEFKDKVKHCPHASSSGLRVGSTVKKLALEVGNGNKAEGFLSPVDWLRSGKTSRSFCCKKFPTCPNRSPSMRLSSLLFSGPGHEVGIFSIATRFPVAAVTASCGAATGHEFWLMDFAMSTCKVGGTPIAVIAPGLPSTSQGWRANAVPSS